MDVDCSDHCRGHKWPFWTNFFAKYVFSGYDVGPKKSWLNYFGFYPPKKGPKVQASVLIGWFSKIAGGSPTILEKRGANLIKKYLRQHCWRPSGTNEIPPHFWKTPRIFGKPPKTLKNGPLKATKSENRSPQKKAFPRIDMDSCFLQKTASKLVKFGLGSSISDLHPPIGGHHPVLYLYTQMTKKYSTAMC